MEQDQNSREEEVAPQDQVPEAVENNESQESAPEAQETHDLEDKQERNWREIRNKQREAEIREKAKDELIERLLKAQQAQQTEAPAQKDEFEGIAPDDYPTWELTDKRIKNQAEAIAEKKFRELEAQRE